jgi:Protein of unknown function (DUF3396)
VDDRKFEMDNDKAKQFELFLTVQGTLQRLVALSFGLTLFTPIPFRDTARAVKVMFDDYLSFVPMSTFHWQNLGGTSNAYKPISPRAFSTIDAWLTLRRSYGRSCAIWLKDGQTITDVGDHLFRLWGTDTAKTASDSNFACIFFPWTILDSTGSELFMTRMHQILQHVPFHSGYLGYTLSLSTLGQVAPYSDEIERKTFAIAQRYLGVEIVKPHLENYEMKSFLRPPSWTTFLSSPFIEKLGGIDQLRSSLKGNFIFRELDHGWSIQAGAKPQIGDRNRREDISPEQRLFARYLRSYYSDRPAYLFNDRPYEDTVAWMRRLIE